jgi:hypothetical protein
LRSRLAVLVGLAISQDALSYRDAARLFGAANEVRQRLGVVRLKIYEADYKRAGLNSRAQLAHEGARHG